MRIIESQSGLKVWLSANDTYRWATREGQCWPGSELSGKRVFAESGKNGDLVDVAIDGRAGVEVDATELNACLSDHIAIRYPSPQKMREEVSNWRSRLGYVPKSQIARRY